ncbi:hypothetical protein VTO73DRAFT_11684 [Trametes versicolor]
MPTYFIFNKVIDPDTGYFDVTVPDNAKVYNILNEIWEECGDHLKETWPKLMRVDLQLYYLVRQSLSIIRGSLLLQVDPIVGRDGGQGRVLREMAEYKNEKRLLDRLDRVASLPDLPEDHIVFELCVSSRVAPLRPETIVEQGRLKAFARIEKVASPSEVAKDPK